MIKERAIFCLSKIVLESQSAHGIQSGLGDTTHDVLLVRDANGLPALPGSSIAGVLRHRYREQFGKENEEAIFGNLDHPSWLSIQWGVIHNANNQACEGLLYESEILDDPILYKLKEDKPLVRQRVRLNSFGTTVDHGKFDTTLIPAGARYSTFISYWCDGTDISKARWEKLQSLLTQPLYMGHGTRSGSGLFNVIEHKNAIWDLRTEAGKEAYLARPRSRNEQTGLSPAQVEEGEKLLTVTIPIEAEGGFRIGGGEVSLLSTQINRTKIPDILPQHEIKIVWQGNKAKLSKIVHLIPGSAIKGAIRHRVAYHYRRLTGEFISASASHNRAMLARGAEESHAVRVLFGFSASEDKNRDDISQVREAGCLIFNDIHIEDADVTALMHNKIDRFTGGVIGGALFEEEILWKPSIAIKINVLPYTTEIEPTVRQALQATLEDLASGLLPLGAGGSRGLGTFTLSEGKSIDWSDGGKWALQKENSL